MQPRLRLPGTGGTDNPMSEWLTAWEGKSTKLGIKGPPYRELGATPNGRTAWSS